MKESNEELVELMEKMLVIREFETTVQKHFAEGEIPGFVHLYLGEEAEQFSRQQNSCPN